MTYTHRYAWRNGPPEILMDNTVRAALYGRLCRIVAHGKRDSVLLEFKDGTRVVTSRRAVRRVRS